MALKRKETRRRGRKRDDHRKGLGGDSIKVKGVRATAAQRSAIDDALSEADELNASRRVMIALVMAGTQESSWTRAGKTGNDDVSYLQQGREWISAENARDAAKASRAFLIGHEADVGGTGRVQGWKQRHGSLKNAPGNLSTAIGQVQLPRRDLYGEYGRWQDEATRTVETWIGGGGRDGGGSYAKRYEFTRGERDGKRESSWDAMARLAEEVGFRRWAAGNVLYYASENELRAAASSVVINGDEGWLLSRPQWDWGSGRAASELTLRVLADRWHVMPGGVVTLATSDPVRGRWLVKTVSGARLDSPEVDVVLKRPTAHRPEPATELASRSDDDSGGDAKSSDLLDVCKHISGQDRPYVYGGGHGVKLSSIGPKAGLDCSSSVSLALKRAKMFPGDVAMVSGQFQTSWGKPGKGREFTVWANPSHMFIEFHDAGAIKRFDTVPWGDGPRGPHIRKTVRSNLSGFTARHWA